MKPKTRQEKWAADRQVAGHEEVAEDADIVAEETLLGCEELEHDGWLDI